MSNPTIEDRLEWTLADNVKKAMEISRLSCEGKLKDAAIELAWSALRWADGPDEGLPSDKWTEIPKREAIKAFDAIQAVRVSEELPHPKQWSEKAPPYDDKL